MKKYQPTNDEIDALYKIMPHAIDVININNNMFYDKHTSDADRKKIYKMSKDLYQSALKIQTALRNAIHG